MGWGCLRFCFNCIFYVYILFFLILYSPSSLCLTLWLCDMILRLYDLVLALTHRYYCLILMFATYSFVFCLYPGSVWLGRWIRFFVFVMKETCSSWLRTSSRRLGGVTYPNCLCVSSWTLWVVVLIFVPPEICSPVHCDHIWAERDLSQSRTDAQQRRSLGMLW